MRNTFSAFVLAVVTVTAAAADNLGSAVRAGELLPNGGFEGESGPKGIVEGWCDNSSWADVDVQYQPDTANPHSGKSCQQVHCTRFGSGAIQMIPTTATALKRNGIYRVRAWLRGDPGMRIAVQMRQAPSPYQVYVEDGIVVGPHWQAVEYLWTSNVDDPKALLMLRFAQAGHVWVDDVSVQEMTLEEALKGDPAPLRGNLLRNGGFDLGLANWLVGHGCDQWREAALSIQQTDNGPCLRIVIPEGGAIASEAVDLAPGHPTLISCRVKAEKPMKIGFPSNHSGRVFEVKEEWQRIEVRGRSQFEPRPRGFVRISFSEPGVLWVDDVQLRQDGQESGGDIPQAAILTDRYPLSLYHEGEDLQLRLMSSSPSQAAPVEFAWRVEDFWGHRVEGSECTPPPGRQERRIPLPTIRRGWYRAIVSWRHEGRELRNESTFCLLPPPGRRGDVLKSPFGAHFSLDPTGLALARAVGCRWLRLHPPNHTKWRVVEPKKAEWQWRDETIRIAKDAALELIGSLDRCPSWASSAPPGTPDNCFYTGTGAWVPRSWEEWENYVTQTVRHYRKDIHIWEVWNEPNLEDWLVPREGQTQPQAYVELLHHTYPIVKREDPTAVVIGACIAGAIREKSPQKVFADDIIAQGALHLMDIFSFHEYITRSVDEGVEPIQAWLPRLQDQMRAAGRSLPIINSEGGYSNPGTCLTYRPCPANIVPPGDMARWLVRQYVAQWALGVRQFCFYNFFIDGSPTIQEWEGFLEGDGQPRPNVAAYAAMTWLLDGASFYRTERPTQDIWVHRFTTARGPLAVVWALTGTIGRLNLPDASEAWDLMGAPMAVPPDKMLAVSDAPMYVVFKE